MKNKIIFSAILAAIFIVAMLVYRDSMTLKDLILSFVGASGIIAGMWQWFNKEEQRKEKERVMRDFEKKSGMTVQGFRQSEEYKNQ